MLLATELVPSSQVSTRDVSYPSPSKNIPLDQYRNGSWVSFEPARISVAMARFITVNDVQEAASTREHGLIGQLLTHRRGISRTGCIWLSAVMLASATFWWMVEIIDLKKEKRLFEARAANGASCPGLKASVIPRCGVLRV